MSCETQGKREQAGRNAFVCSLHEDKRLLGGGLCSSGCLRMEAGDFVLEYAVQVIWNTKYYVNGVAEGV